MSPTQRTLAQLRKLGYLAAVVERWNPHAKVRQDLVGFVDVLALRQSRSAGYFGAGATIFSAVLNAYGTRPTTSAPAVDFWKQGYGDRN